MRPARGAVCCGCTIPQAKDCELQAVGDEAPFGGSEGQDCYSKGHRRTRASRHAETPDAVLSRVRHALAPCSWRPRCPHFVRPTR